MFSVLSVHLCDTHSYVIICLIDHAVSCISIPLFATCSRLYLVIGYLVPEYIPGPKMILIPFSHTIQKNFRLSFLSSRAFYLYCFATYEDINYLAAIYSFHCSQ